MQFVQNFGGPEKTRHTHLLQLDNRLGLNTWAGNAPLMLKREDFQDTDKKVAC